MAPEKENPDEQVRFMREDGKGDVAVANRGAFKQLYEGQGWVEVGTDNKPLKAAASAAAKDGDK